MRIRWHLRRAGGAGTVGVNLPHWITRSLHLRPGQRIELEVRDDALVVHLRRPASALTVDQEEQPCHP